MIARYGDILGRDPGAKLYGIDFTRHADILDGILPEARLESIGVATTPARQEIVAGSTVENIRALATFKDIVALKAKELIIVRQSVNMIHPERTHQNVCAVATVDVVGIVYRWRGRRGIPI